MTEQKKEERIVIQTTTYGMQWETKFFLDIQAAIDDGYRIAETDRFDDMSLRNFNGNMGRVVMYLKGYEPEKWKPAVVETAPVKEDPLNLKEETKEEDLSTGRAENAPAKKEVKVEEEKEELPVKEEAKEAASPNQFLVELEEVSDYKGMKALAEKHGVDMPEKVYNPKAVKKYFKDKLKA